MGTFSGGNVLLPRLTVVQVVDQTFDGGVVTLPVVTASGHFAPAMRLPALTVSGLFYTGTLVGGRVRLPAITVSGVIYTPLRIPRITVSGSFRTSDQYFTANLTLPVITVDGAFYQNQIFSGSITLPVLSVIGSFSTPLPAVDTAAGAAGTGTGLQLSAGEALVMNLRNSAASTYENFGFNSFATFNGVVLGANATGIYAIASGDLDDTAAIAATVTLGVTNLGDDHMKRVSRAYVGLRTNGQWVLRVRVDEGEWFEYELEDRDVEGVHGTRVKIGKGLKGRYWQAELANINGASGELDELALVPEVLSRKVA